MPSPLRSWFAFRSVTVLAVLLIMGLGALAAPPAAQAQKKVLNIAAKEPDTLDPHTSILGQTQAIKRFMYRGLTRFAIKDGKVTTAEVEPDLAESWTLSPDGTVWTFKLKKGVQFHKGFGELTAEDVKFSFERQINRAPGTRFGVNLEVIKSIEVVDPHTVQIALKAFDPIFLLRMVGYQQGYIVSKKAAEKHGEQFKWNPVGTGPFYFERHSPREKIVLKAFDKYHGGQPQIDEVHWFDVPEDATKLIGLEKGTFDLLYPGGGHRRLRRPGQEDGRGHRPAGPGRAGALLHQHDQAALRRHPRAPGLHARHRPQGHQGDHVPRRSGAAGHRAACPPATSATSRWTFPEYDPEKAKKLLAEAGHPNGFTIKNYFISKSFFYPKVLTLAQEQLKKVGINVELQVVEHATYHENIRKNLNPFVLYGGTRITDADPWLSLFFDSQGDSRPGHRQQGHQLRPLPGRSTTCSPRAGWSAT